MDQKIKITDLVADRLDIGLSPTNFMVNDEFIERLESALSRLPNGKATGPNALFSEVFRIEKEKIDQCCRKIIVRTGES